jgi:hypothetical protein
MSITQEQGRLERLAGQVADNIIEQGEPAEGFSYFEAEFIIAALDERVEDDPTLDGFRVYRERTGGRPGDGRYEVGLMLG